MSDKNLPHQRDVIVVALEQALADHAGNPLKTTIQLMSDLVEAYSSRELVIVSDRVESLREGVVVWLNTHVDYYHEVVMRPMTMHTSAATLMKARIESAGAPGSRMPLPSRVLCAFDSRPEMRTVWADYGVPCYLTPGVK
jgi:hypothetical protein